MAGDLERIIAALVGAAFGTRALDSRKELWARAAYGAVGFDLLRGAWTGSVTTEPAGVGRVGKSIRAANGEKTVSLAFEERRARNIAERVAQVHEQMVKGEKDPRVYALARKVLNRKCGETWCVPERDSMGEVASMFAEVRQRVRYTWDPVSYDSFQTPTKTLELGTGDCDDQVALLGALLRSIGYQVRSRVVHTRGFSTWNHIYLMCRLPTGQWIPLDPTVNKPPGWQVPAEIMLREPRDFDVQERGGPKIVGGT